MYSIFYSMSAKPDDLDKVTALPCCLAEVRDWMSWFKSDKTPFLQTVCQCQSKEIMESF